MVLSGSLHEFILADVFQLLAQQKATGKLVVTNDKRSGFVVLHNGELIAAIEERSSLESRLVNCLVTFKKIPYKEVTKLLSGTANRISAFSAAVVQKKLLSETEIIDLARTSIEDITCSLFAWTQGTYRFESLEKISDFVVHGVSVGTDSIIMEAMRRIDELKRQQFRIPLSTVYVRTDETTPADFGDNVGQMLAEPDNYLISFLNGTVPLAALPDKCCLGHYQIIDSIVRLAADNRIAPLSARMSRSIQAAMSHDTRLSMKQMLGLAGSIAACIVILIAAMSARVMLNFRYADSALHTLHGQTDADTAQRKRSAAIIIYGLRMGHPPQSDADLVESRLLGIRDIYAPGR